MSEGGWVVVEEMNLFSHCKCLDLSLPFPAPFSSHSVSRVISMMEEV